MQVNCKNLVLQYVNRGLDEIDFYHYFGCKTAAVLQSRGGRGYVCNKMKMGRQDVGGFLWSPGYESNCNVEYKIKCLATMQWESPRHGNRTYPRN